MTPTLADELHAYERMRAAEERGNASVAAVWAVAFERIARERFAARHRFDHDDPDRWPAPTTEEENPR